MKKIITVLVMTMFLTNHGFGQQTNNQDTICMHPEIQAAFPGGPSVWKRFLGKYLNINIPIDNNAPKGIYTVILKFIVSKDGAVSNVVAETNVGYGMEDEAIRVMKRSPKWVPANYIGQNVKALRRQSVIFTVE